MSKICGICSEDCSDRPRVKDQKGRYYCKACVAEHEKRAAAAALASATIAAVPADDEPFQLEDDQAFELADDGPGSNPLPIEMLDQVEKVRGCPVCMHTLAPGAKICIACGYDMEKGIQSSTLVEKAASKKNKGKRGYLCANCGYDLKGLRDPVCPECGTRFNASKRARWDKETERQVIRTEWNKPFIAGAIGLVGMLIVLTMRDMLDSIPFVAMFVGAEIVIGYAVLWMSFMFLGDIGTPLLNLVRLIALYLVVDTLWLLVMPVPSFWLRNGVTGLAYIGLFTSFFDVDWEDAWFVMIFNWLVKMGLVITAAVILMNA